MLKKLLLFAYFRTHTYVYEYTYIHTHIHIHAHIYIHKIIWTLTLMRHEGQTAYFFEHQ